MILIQERLQGEPYKLLIGCILCNLTKGSKALPVLKKLFALYPTVEDIANSNQDDLVQILMPLGFQNRRAATLIKFSKGWILASEEDYLEDLPGVGKYAVDSYRLFVHNDWSVEPDDKELVAYIKRNKQCHTY